MLTINTFAIHDLVGFVVTAALAMLFYVAYLAMGRRLIDLLFANWLACVAVACFNYMLMDNVIPQGTSAAAVPHASTLTLWWLRFNYLTGLIGTVTMVHFVLCYTKSRYATGMPVRLGYLACLMAVPLIWSPWFLTERAQPLAETSSWSWAIPWAAETGPLVIGYVALYFAATAILVIVLWRHKTSTSGPAEENTGSMIAWVRVAFGILCLAGTLDVLLAIIGFNGPSPMPVGAVLVSAAISVALVAERRAAERHRCHIEEQLRIAGEIQRELLPTASPDVSGFSLGGWSRAAESAGGDTYDFLQLPGGQWMVSLADASGHGVGPALIADETRAMLRALTLRSLDAAGILRELDALLALDLPECHFVTCFLGLLDPASATLSYASAGQGPILFYEVASDRLRQEAATDMPLGILRLKDVRQTVRQHKFETGTFLAIVSDGLYEAANASGQQFGIPRLAQALYRHRHLPPGEMITTVWHEVDQFCAGADQRDDMTMVVLKKD
jgi:serine phosphatase RsbU (regulator of sigma subunit)